MPILARFADILDSVYGFLKPGATTFLGIKKFQG